MRNNDFSKEELANSKRIQKSATPKFDLSWYVKWTASLFILMGMSIRGVDGFEFWDLLLSIIGVGGWLWVGLLWKDRALVMLNSAGLLFLVNNFIRLLIGV